MGLISTFTGLGSFKMTLIASVVTAAIVGTTAFIAGVRWEKADRYDAALAQIQQIEAQAAQSLDHLNNAWGDATEQVKLDIKEWNLQNSVDAALFNRLLAGQADIRSQFDELESDIFVTTDFGTCQLSNDAIQLLRKATFAANAGLSGS